MSGWGRHLDDVTGAVTQLLLDGVVRQSALHDPVGALVARDIVLVELRELVGAVADVPQFAEVRPLSVDETANRPAQALHRALSALPRAVAFGEVELAAVDGTTLPGYERAWQRAACASLALERYVDGLRGLPDQYVGLVLRDLADLAATLPFLDHDLSEALRPRLNRGEDFRVAYRMLAHSGHNALSRVTAEVRAHTPVAEPPALVRPHLSQLGQQVVQSGTRALGARGPDGAGELTEAMIRFTHAVSVRSAHLSVPDLRAVTRLLESGCAHACLVLERAASAVAGAGQTAAGLRAVVPTARQLRDTPARSMTSPHLDLLRAGTELQTRLEALAGQALQLPAGAPGHDLRRLAAPALEFARHVPALAGALDLSVREAVAARLMLVPGIADPPASKTISWVTATMGPQRNGPPAIVTTAGELSAAARRVATAARHVDEDLVRNTVAAPSPTQQASSRGGTPKRPAANCERRSPNAVPANPSGLPQPGQSTPAPRPRHRPPARAGRPDAQTCDGVAPLIAPWRVRSPRPRSRNWSCSPRAAPALRRRRQRHRGCLRMNRRRPTAPAPTGGS